jgi:hypothetical protein
LSSCYWQTCSKKITLLYYTILYYTSYVTDSHLIVGFCTVLWLMFWRFGGTYCLHLQGELVWVDATVIWMKYFIDCMLGFEAV